MKKTKLTRSLLAAVSIVALSAVMYGCVHSGDSDSEPAVEMPDPPTAYEAGKAAIMAATTAEAAQAAYDEVDQTAISGQEAASLQAALDSQLMALDTAARVEAQKMALMAAAGMIDTSDLSTQEAVDAARAAIVMLRGALAAAADVSDADRTMYMSMLDDAVMAVDAAQGGIDTDTRRTDQMAALSSASMALQTALTALAGQAPTQAQIDAASSALADLNSAIEDAADLTAGETATYQREADNAEAPIDTAQASLDDAEDDAEADRLKAEAEAKAKADAAMAATAAKLYAGLEHGLGDTTNIRTGASDAEGVVSVTIGSGSAVALAEDKKTTVAALHGWEGKRHTAEPDGGGTYEAYVYSNVGEPTQGDKFNVQYTLLTTATATVLVGEVGVDTSTEPVQMRVDSPSFDQSAGKKEFELGTNLQRVMISGTYHGVPGNFYCTPTDADTQCSSSVAAQGFTLGGGTWAFKPSNPEARVMSTDDTVYASYGWWLHTEAGGGLVASAFATSRGTVTAAADIADLKGTATYVGGAAGKYALSSTTGGKNDAGHFTARAMLEADFSDNMISGTIDDFMGADGMSRNWSVELMEQGVSTTGTILGDDGTGTVGTDEEKTKWTVDGTAADAAGQWSGTLYDNDDDSGVPQVATGTFYSEFGRDGKMVGAFGAKEE